MLVLTGDAFNIFNFALKTNWIGTQNSFIAHLKSKTVFEKATVLFKTHWSHITIELLRNYFLQEQVDTIFNNHRKTWQVSSTRYQLFKRSLSVIYLKYSNVLKALSSTVTPNNAWFCKGDTTLLNKIIIRN